MDRSIWRRTATRWLAGLAAAVAATVAVLPATAQTVLPYGPAQGPFVGTMTSSKPWLSDCSGIVLHQSATMVITVTYAEGTYVGPVTVTLDTAGVGANGACPPYLTTMTMSIAGSNALGNTFACRAAGSPANAPAPMTGFYASLGASPNGTAFLASTTGTCAINGVDSAVTASMDEVGLMAPSGLSTAVITGVITLWN